MNTQQSVQLQTRFDVSADEIRRAKFPHEVFLVNLIFNHIFLFVASLSVVQTFPVLIFCVPLVSFCCMTYILLQARREMHGPSWYVRCHWQLAAKRNRMFMLLLLLSAAVIGGGWAISGLLHLSRISTYALIGGFGLLPFMVTLLILIIMGNEAVHLAKHGMLPAWVVERYSYCQPQASVAK